MKTFWYMNMKQGSDGDDFAEELWNQDLVGVLFGTWSIGEVADEHGEPVREKVRADTIQRYNPQPRGIDHGRDFNDKFLSTSRKFLFNVAVGDRVVVVFDNTIHLGTIGKEFADDPNPPRGKYQEVLKCRRIESTKSFPLSELPSSYRLISGSGRRAVQKIDTYRAMIELLDSCATSKEVVDSLAGISTSEFLGLISPDQWELICDEYLRDKVGLRSLLLDVGRTLKAVDIVGVSDEGNRILAQCKNDPSFWKPQRVSDLIDAIPKQLDDEVYFFCRGGVRGDISGLNCTIVDGDEIAAWLDSDPDYFTRIKTM